MDAVLTALLIPFLGTALGSAFVFFMRKDMPQPLQKLLLGFASICPLTKSHQIHAL